MSAMHSFTADTGRVDHHAYRGTSWNTIAIHQPVKVMKETIEDPINIDLYCCKITIIRLDKIELVTVEHIPGENSKYAFYFLLLAGMWINNIISC